MPSLDPLPQTAAWRHLGPREGTEVLLTARTPHGHRLPLPLGRAADVPAAFVRADDLRVERLEQTYERLDRAGEVAYTSSTFDVACTLTHDDAGLVLDYPGIAVRLR